MLNMYEMVTYGFVIVLCLTCGNPMMYRDAWSYKTVCECETAMGTGKYACV